ncbi:MAG: NUDIX domain-containing protein [Elusimicrobiota bacterium]|jgi:8-oxo-dGTP diphosphatase
MSSRRVDSSQAVLVTSGGELLLMKKTVDYPQVPGGVWALFGGGIEPGETPRQAVERELKEELGWAPKRALPYVSSRRYSIPGRNHGIKHTFAFRISRDLSGLSLREGAGFALFTQGELRSIKVSPYDLPDITAFLGATR